MFPPASAMGFQSGGRHGGGRDGLELGGGRATQEIDWAWERSGDGSKSKSGHRSK